MKHIFTLSLFCFALQIGIAQNFADNIAELIYTKCGNCHRPGEIGPFPLTNYLEVKNRANLIKHVTESRYMPPWKPDPHYQNYQNENYLSLEEIDLIGRWVNNGSPQGDPLKEPAFPNFPSGSQVGTPDLIVSFAQSYTHKGNNRDEYRYFVLPTNLTEDKDLVALEMRPGNKQAVHHTLFWADDTGMAKAEDDKTPEYGFSGGGAAGFLGDQLPGYVPGQKPNIFPEGMSQKIKKGSDLVLQMHYAPSAKDEQDSSVVNLFFSKKPAKRQVYNKIMLPTNLVNGPFIMPPQSVTTFHGVYKLPIDVSLLGIWPHCHLLGKSWEVYAKLPNGEQIPLIKIDDWDFNWQGGYYFQKLIVLPRGSEVHAFASYDNSDNNPVNPNNPPKTVSWGEGTADEMYYLPLSYVLYQPGDEDLVLDSDDIEGNGGLSKSLINQILGIFPNPATDKIQLPFVINSDQKIEINILNSDGSKISNLLSMKTYIQGQHLIPLKLPELKSGLYLIELKSSSWALTEKLIIHK